MSRGSGAPAEAEQIDLDPTDSEIWTVLLQSSQLPQHQGRHLLDPSDDTGVPLAGALAVEGVVQTAAGANAFDIYRYIGLFGLRRQLYERVVRIKVIQPRDVADIVAVAVVRRVAIAVIAVGSTALADVLANLYRHPQVDRIATRRRLAIGLVVSGAVEEQTEAQHDASLSHRRPFVLPPLHQVVGGGACRASRAQSADRHPDRSCWWVPRPCRSALRLVGAVDERVDQPGPAGTAAEAVQGARHRSSITADVRHATDDLVDLPILAAGDPIPLTCMGDTKHHDAGVGIQHRAAAGGLVTPADEISHCHIRSFSEVESPAGRN
ncbi:hypothetical protein D9M69_479980 [compost metagenome]